jgi:hypothetical protein
MRSSEKWRTAIKKKKSMMRTKMFKAARNQANYTEYSLHVPYPEHETFRDMPLR